MARIYAGILGPLALLTTLAHGALHAQPVDATLLGAWWALLIFAALGSVIGWIAGHTVEEEVRARIAGEDTSDPSFRAPVQRLASTAARVR